MVGSLQYLFEITDRTGQDRTDCTYTVCVVVCLAVLYMSLDIYLVGSDTHGLQVNLNLLLIIQMKNRMLYFSIAALSMEAESENFSFEYRITCINHKRASMQFMIKCDLFYFEIRIPYIMKSESITMFICILIKCNDSNHRKRNMV